MPEQLRFNDQQESHEKKSSLDKKSFSSQDLMKEFSLANQILQKPELKLLQNLTPKQSQEFSTKATTINEKYKTKTDQLQQKFQHLEQQKLQSKQDVLQNFMTKNAQLRIENMQKIEASIIPKFTTAEGISSQELTAAVQNSSYDLLNSSYDLLGLDVETTKNGPVGQFMKGIVDSLLVNNIEFVEQVKNNPKILLELFQALFSKEGMPLILKSLGTTLTDLFTGDPYKTAKSIGDISQLVLAAKALATGFAKGVQTLERASILDQVSKIKSSVQSLEELKELGIFENIEKLPINEKINLLKKVDPQFMNDMAKDINFMKQKGIDNNLLKEQFNLTDEELFMIRKYSGDGLNEIHDTFYKNFNQFHRNTLQNSISSQQALTYYLKGEVLSSALETKNIPKYTGEIYRYLSREDEKLFQKTINDIKSLGYEKGNGFNSFSKMPQIEYKGKYSIQLIIQSPKNGRDISGISTKPRQQEILLNKGKKLIVKEIKINPTGNSETDLIIYLKDQ